jgi:hypothetical protein
MRALACHLTLLLLQEEINACTPSIRTSSGGSAGGFVVSSIERTKKEGISSNVTGSTGIYNINTGTTIEERE